MRFIDLSHTIKTAMPVYPGDPPVSVKQVAKIGIDGYGLRRFEFGSHTGTHMDAPAHVLEGGRSLDRISPERFVGPAVVLRATDLRKIDADALRALPLATADFLLLHTGWDKKWGQTAYYEGYPTLTADAVEFLKTLSLKGVGFDCPGPDAAGEDLWRHRALLGADILLIENLTGLEKLPATGSIFYAIPLPIRDADASPVRAFATVEGEGVIS